MTAPASAPFTLRYLAAARMLRGDRNILVTLEEVTHHGRTTLYLIEDDPLARTRTSLRIESNLDPHAKMESVLAHHRQQGFTQVPQSVEQLQRIRARARAALQPLAPDTRPRAVILQFRPRNAPSPG